LWRAKLRSIFFARPRYLVNDACVFLGKVNIYGSVFQFEGQSSVFCASIEAHGAKSLIGRLLHFDAWRMKFRELNLEKDPNCPVCGKNPSIKELIDYEQFCGLKKDQNSEPIETITAIDLKKRLDAGDKIQFIDIREPHERAIVKFPNAIIMSLGQLVRRMEELDTSIDSVFLCKIGQLSILGIRALRDAGYKGKLLNLQDGLNAWARDVDRSMPVY